MPAGRRVVERSFVRASAQHSASLKAITARQLQAHVRQRVTAGARVLQVGLERVLGGRSLRATSRVPQEEAGARRWPAATRHTRPEGQEESQSARAHFGLSKSSRTRSEEHTSELQSQSNLVCRLLLEKKN